MMVLMISFGACLRSAKLECSWMHICALSRGSELQFLKWGLNNTSPSFGPISRYELEALVIRAYSDRSSELHLHQLGLLLAVLAAGALHCLEYPPEEASAFAYASAATECLSRGNVFAQSTVAGLQCLVSTLCVGRRVADKRQTQLAHFHSVTEAGRRRGIPWPLWTLSVRMVQDVSPGHELLHDANVSQMRLHREVYESILPTDVLKERRLVFWECYSSDVMVVRLALFLMSLVLSTMYQAQCYSRPSVRSFKRRTFSDGLHRPMIRSSQYDVAFPPLEPGDRRDCEYRQLKYDFVRLIER